MLNRHRMRKRCRGAAGLVLLLAMVVGCGDDTFRQGESLYLAHCENCHQTDGKGLGALIPPLAGADYLRLNPAGVACGIRYGYADTLVVNDTPYPPPMPGVAELSEFQITNIINYINHAWGNDYGFVKLEDVRRALEQCGTTGTQK